MVQDEASMEVNYMANQNRQDYHQGGNHQGGNFSQNQGQGCKSLSRNKFNKDQGVPSYRPPNQGLNLYERTTKLEDTLTQFMQVSISNHKSTESAIKKLEMQVGQLSKQPAEKSNGKFVANTEQNPKEQCKEVLTRSKRMKGLVADELVEGIVEDVSDDDEVEERERKRAENKEKKNKS